MLGITLGDPNGVGPEILIRSFMQKDLPGDVVVIGDYDIVRFCMNYLKLNVPLARIRSVKDMEPGRLNILDQGCMKETDLSIGKISEKGGGASLKYIEIATELALSGEIDAIITLPVHKEAVRLVHKDFRGHTDHIATLCGVNHFTMMLVSDRLIVTHISMHVSMKEAIDKISIPNILEVIRLTHRIGNAVVGLLSLPAQISTKSCPRTEPRDFHSLRSSEAQDGVATNATSFALRVVVLRHRNEVLS